MVELKKQSEKYLKHQISEAGLTDSVIVKVLTGKDAGKDRG